MLSVRNLVNTTDLTADDIDQILACARTFEEVNSRTIKKLPTLRGRTVVNLFLEPSTRTKSSFELACKRLGADTLSIAGSSSAQAKGESLVDTVSTFARVESTQAYIDATQDDYRAAKSAMRDIPGVGELEQVSNILTGLKGLFGKKK